MAGLLFGPAAGGMVGAVSDILGYPLCPAGPYSPLFTLTAALTGIIPALILKNYREERLTFWALTLAIFAGQFVTKVLLVPFFLQVQFGVPFAFKSSSNLLVEMIHAPIYAVLSRSLLLSFGHIFPSEPLRCSPMEERAPENASITCTLSKKEPGVL